MTEGLKKFQHHKGDFVDELRSNVNLAPDEKRGNHRVPYENRRQRERRARAKASFFRASAASVA